MLGDREIGEIFYKFSVQYCLSQENHLTCAKYKIYEQGEKPPLNLFPDGKKVHIADLLLKRKIIEEEIK